MQYILLKNYFKQPTVNCLYNLYQNCKKSQYCTAFCVIVRYTGTVLLWLYMCTRFMKRPFHTFPPAREPQAAPSSAGGTELNIRISTFFCISTNCAMGFPAISLACCVDMNAIERAHAWIAMRPVLRPVLRHANCSAQVA